MLPDIVDRLGEGFDLKRLLQRGIVAEFFRQTGKSVSRGEYDVWVERDLLDDLDDLAGVHDPRL